MRVQHKTLVLGLLAGVVGLWLLLSWDPVLREEPAEMAVAQVEPIPAKPTAAPPPAAAPIEAPAPAEEPEPEPTPEAPVPELRTASGELQSSMKLTRFVDQDVDMANLPPPSASGPVIELQKEFESGARDASSAALEERITSAFKLQHVAPELLDSAVCHGSTCRVRTRWTSARAGGFAVAMTTLASQLSGEEGSAPLFDRNFGLGQASERNSNGERSIDVYFRRAAGAAK